MKSKDHPDSPGGDLVNRRRISAIINTRSNGIQIGRIPKITIGSMGHYPSERAPSLALRLWGPVKNTVAPKNKRTL